MPRFLRQNVPKRLYLAEEFKLIQPPISRTRAHKYISRRYADLRIPNCQIHDAGSKDADTNLEQAVRAPDLTISSHEHPHRYVGISASRAIEAVLRHR